MVDINQSFTNMLYELKQKGITQAHVAKRAGVTPAAISDVASGSTINPRWETAATIINLYDYHVKGISTMEDK